jgi:hypothetical protein
MYKRSLNVPHPKLLALRRVPGDSGSNATRAGSDNRIGRTCRAVLTHDTQIPLDPTEGKQTLSPSWDMVLCGCLYSTVTLFARFRGWST